MRTTPEIVHPQKAAFQQVGPELARILLAEKEPAHFLHHDEGALEQFIARQPDNDVLRLS